MPGVRGEDGEAMTNTDKSELRQSIDRDVRRAKDVLNQLSRTPTKALMQAFIMGLVGRRGEAGVEKAELRRLCEWAEGVQLDATLLCLIAHGELDAHWPEGGEMPTFSNPGKAV